MNNMLLDGNMFGIDKDMTHFEALRKVREKLGSGVIFLMSNIHVNIDGQLYTLKNRTTGECDFK